jgi:hypothetical protein
VLASKIAEDMERKSEKKDLVLKISIRWDGMQYDEEIRLVSGENTFGSLICENTGKKCNEFALMKLVGLSGGLKMKFDERFLRMKLPVQGKKYLIRGC